MFGSGNYKMVAVKEIKVTKYFHNLNEEQKKCQEVESYENCVTRLHLQTINDKCGCVPYNLADFNNNDTVIINYILFLKLKILTKFR